MADKRTGTVEQMDANVEAMARDLQEILRIERSRRDCGRCIKIRYLEYNFQDTL